uniref:WD_REPEATS_REGION domain-containing protein n=1 Tax=Heterorhabditis bacteriophora TaxID=37862 RepID=A0A1I7XVK5_HETBA
MRRTDSTLFAPFRTMGVVCSEVRPVFRLNMGQRRMTSIFCPVDNVVIHYSADKLRLIAISDTFPDPISAITADKTFLLILTVVLTKTVKYHNPHIGYILYTLILTIQVIVDDQSGIRVFDISNQQMKLHLEGVSNFTVTAVVHPSTYTNKILLGSSNGTMRLINIRSGRLIYEFSNSDFYCVGFGAAITVLEQSPAVDVIAIGLENGKVILHNVKTDETICSFRHDKMISAVGFRNDGEPLMTTADIGGDIAVWNLEKKELVGKITHVHSGAVTELFLHQLIIRCELGSWMVLMVCLASSSSWKDMLKESVQFNLKDDKKKQAKKLHRSVADIRLEPVIDIVLGSSREAAWDNAICRHKWVTSNTIDTLLVTTWTTRKNSQGAHKIFLIVSFQLIHSRFLEDPTLCNASATALCLSPCGNFAFIGYSTGHVDQFNVQSGLHMKNFCEIDGKNNSINESRKRKTGKAHSAAITVISVDVRGSELITGCSEGRLKFWNIRKCKCIAKMSTRYRIMKCATCVANSLLAIACEGGEAGLVAIVDTLCRRVVRVFDHVGEKINALTFSSDGRWLLTADNHNYIRNERAIYIWASKKMFAAHLNIRALPIDYLPTWDSRNDDIGMNTFIIDDESDEEIDIMSLKIDPSLVTYSGLAPSRWANLPILSVIKDRNKPIEAPRKVKQAPFFLTAIPTLDGFDFDLPNEENGEEHRKMLQAKRSMLELESSFSSSLRSASNAEDLLCVFNILKKMSVSAIDFQLRSMPADVLPNFFKMLIEVL